MSAPPPPPSLLFSAAQLEAERAAVGLLLPDLSEAPQWLCHALQSVAALAGAVWHEQRAALSCPELRADIVRFREAVDALQRRLSLTPIIAATVTRHLLPDGVELSDLLPGRAETLLAKLTGSGRASAFDRLGIPAPKEVIAGGVTALCRELLGTVPNAKNTRLLALCGALLWWAREQAEDPAAAPDARRSQWVGSLDLARQIYGTDTVLAAGKVDAADLVRYGVDQALAHVRQRYTSPGQ
jgi:hypothetical protein